MQLRARWAANQRSSRRRATSLLHRPGERGGAGSSPVRSAGWLCVPCEGGRCIKTRRLFSESTGGLGGQALEHVLELAIRIVAVESGQLDEAHDNGGALTGTQ